MEFAILNKLVESSSLAQRRFSNSINNTLALEDDLDQRQDQTAIGSPHFLTSALGSWLDKEKAASTLHAEYPNEASRQESSQRSNTSDADLLRLSRKPDLGRNLEQTGDQYHDVVRTISMVPRVNGHPVS